MKALILLFSSLLLFGCPNAKNGSSSGSTTGVPTFRDLFKYVGREERNLLEEACGADQNSARCRQAADPNFVNNTMHAPSERRTEQCEACRDHGVQTVASTSNKDWKPGCEVLEGGNKDADKDKLFECLNSLRASISHGAGPYERDKKFCNMYKFLRPEEQHFLGMIMTAVGESRSITNSRGTAPPKFQEALFVQKTLDNRLREARRSTGNENLNALDVALARSQFSMYNSNIFKDENSKFYKLFTPTDRSNDTAIKHAIDAFNGLQNNDEKIEPKPDSDNIGMYYSPHGMTKVSSLPAAQQANEIAKIRRLKAQGKIPSWHPEDRIAPRWDFSNISVVEDLKYDGTAVRTTRPHAHVFYRNNSGRPEYGGRNKVPPKWRAQCGGGQ